MAPARQISRSAAQGARHVIDKRAAIGLYARLGVGLSQRGWVFAGLATTIKDLRCGQRLRNHRVQCLRAQAATHDKRKQTDPNGWRSERPDRAARTGRYARDCPALRPLGSISPESAAEHAARHLGQALVRGAGHGILFVHHQRGVPRSRDHAPGAIFTVRAHIRCRDHA